MIREAFLPKKSHPATLAMIEHANGIMHWLGCAMHDPLAQPPAFSHLLHNQPPERQKRVAGSRSRGAYLGEVRWFVLVLGPFLARGASRTNLRVRRCVCSVVGLLEGFRHHLDNHVAGACGLCDGSRSVVIPSPTVVSNTTVMMNDRVG